MGVGRVDLRDFAVPGVLHRAHLRRSRRLHLRDGCLLHLPDGF